MTRRTMLQEYDHRLDLVRGPRKKIDVTDSDPDEIADQFVELFGRRCARDLLRRVRDAIPGHRTVYNPCTGTFDLIADEDDAA
jgi:hypothetical protein